MTRPDIFRKEKQKPKTIDDISRYLRCIFDSIPSEEKHGSTHVTSQTKKKHTPRLQYSYFIYLLVLACSIGINIGFITFDPYGFQVVETIKRKIILQTNTPRW